MMEVCKLLLILFAILCSICVGNSGSPSVVPDPLLGIVPQDEKYYQSETIKCKNGSKKFNKAQLNDDFCDCPDGTDEPGTSACPQGKFYCRNVGHVSVLLSSSRVNDGICDCCDGSDEYDGKVKCPNTCWEAGKVARDKLKKKIAMFKNGVTIRKQEIEKANKAIAEDEAELSKLKTEEKTLQRLVKQLKVHKEQIEKAEEEERLKKEKEEKIKEAAKEEVVKKEDEAEDETGDNEVVSETSDDDKIGLLEDPPVEQPEKDGLENTEELSREELGRLVASRWTGEKTEQQVEGSDAAKDDIEDTSEIPESVHGEDKDNHPLKMKEIQEDGEDDMEDIIDEPLGEDDVDSFSDPYKPDLEDRNDSDITTLSSQSWFDKIQKTVRTIYNSMFPTSIDLSDADRVRKEYDDSSTRLSEIQLKIASLTEKLKQDFGREKEFYSYYDQCFETKQNKYVYKVCPFKQASQEEGYSRTDLGLWDKFENSYSIMLFSNGDKCWNGPDRSLKVKLRCGLKTEVTDIDEPSRCEYVALMSTPALCVKEKLQELQRKLESMDKEQPQVNDEL